MHKEKRGDYTAAATYPNGDGVFGGGELDNKLTSRLLLGIVQWPEAAHHLNVTLA